MEHAPDGNPTPRLDALEAYLDALDGNSEQALARLSGREDPDSIRRTLTILIDGERYQDASNLVRERAPEREWCERAVSALVQNEEAERARALINWAGSQDDEALRRRCILTYAETRFVGTFKARGKDARIFPGNVTDGEREKLRDLLAVLSPLLRLIEAREEVSTAVEEHTLRLALHAKLLLGERKGAEQLARLSEKRRPLPLFLAEFVLAAGLPAGDELPRRLRDEHPDSFDATLLALLVEGKILGRPAEAFEAALAIDVERLTREQRPRLFNALYALVQNLDQEAMNRVERLAPLLLGHDLPAFKLFLADQFLRTDRPEVAGAILEELRDENDPRWLQLHAHLKYRTGEPDAAMKHLVEASKQIPEADLFRQIARVAHELGRFDVAIDSLEKVTALDPGDLRSRKNLASTLAKVGDFERAAEQFRRLHGLEPDDAHHALNEAASLVLAGNLPAALDVYDALCRPEAPSLPAILGWAEVLKLLDRPEDSFAALRQFRDRFWDDPQFLFAYMSFGYGSGHDGEASAALARVRALQEEGLAPGEAVRSVSLDELKQLLQEQRSRDEIIRGQVLEGHFPWLLTEAARGRVPYLGWATRTQLVLWLPDGLRERTELSVYATNGFAMVAGQDGGGELARPECPERGNAIAADLSSLITLHALGLLGRAADYFGRIVVPASYRERVLDERSRLLPHQLSREVASERLNSALDAGTITVLTEKEGCGAEALPVVDEYADAEGDHFYRLADVFEPMYALGWLSQSEYLRARRACAHLAGAGETHPQLGLFTRLRIELATLFTLSQIGCLQLVIDAFRVRVTKAAAEEIRAGVRQFRNRVEVKKRHSDLWRQLQSDRRIEFLAHVLPPDLAEKDPEGKSDGTYALAASILAKQHGLPLLVDDRVVQVVSQNDRPTVPGVSFGTDILIERLGESGLLTADEAADALLRLMDWRYRFLLPPEGVLKALLDRFRGHPPGRPLRRVAIYVHDCMRDPGLFSGFEQTTPPTSFACRLFQGWSSAIIRFVMLVWADETWDETGARQVTLWAVREFLPSLPMTMPAPMQGILARQFSRLVLSNALIASAMIEKRERANKGLRIVAESLGISEADYHEMVIDVVAEA